MAAALLAGLGTTGCVGPRTGLDEFALWYDNAHAQAQAGQMQWSDFYQQSFDRLAALPSSMQQDSRLEQTVLLLSNARKFESAEMTVQQFNTERALIERR